MKYLIQMEMSYSESISTPCAMSSSWKIVDLRQGRQKADVFDRMLSRYFFWLQTVCPSSYRFCFVFRNVFSISVDSRFHRTILLAKKREIYTLCYFRFCLYLRILKIRLILMLCPNNTWVVSTLAEMSGFLTYDQDSTKK